MIKENKMISWTSKLKCIFQNIQTWRKQFKKYIPNFKEEKHGSGIHKELLQLNNENPVLKLSNGSEQMFHKRKYTSDE